MRNFRELAVWQKAHNLTLALYELTAHFPQDERFGLVTQLRRAAVTMTMSIAHGAGKAERHEFIRLLQTAHGCGSELEYLLLLAHDLHILDVAAYENMSSSLIEIKKMITGLGKTISGHLHNELRA